MSLNTAHASTGVLIHKGEQIIIYADSVTLTFDGQAQQEFKGKKSGRLYLTTHRMIFNSKGEDALRSFSFPFATILNLELEQPILGPNYLKGKVVSQPNGNWSGEAGFKLTFKSGGAIEFGQALLTVVQFMSRYGMLKEGPPTYSTPEGQWHTAPPPEYAPDPQGYYGWKPPRHAFPADPPADTVFMVDAPPPYPGIQNVKGVTSIGGYTRSSCCSRTGAASAVPPPPYTAEPPPPYQVSAQKEEEEQVPSQPL